MAYRRPPAAEIPDIVAQQEARWMDDGVSEGSMDSLDRRILGIPPNENAPRQPILLSQRHQRDIAAPARRPLNHPTKPTGATGARFGKGVGQAKTLQEKLDEMIAQRNAMYEKHVQHERPASNEEIPPPPTPIDAVYTYQKREMAEESLRQREVRVQKEVYIMEEPRMRGERDTRILSRMLLKRPKPLSSAASDLASILGEDLEEYRQEAAPLQRQDEYYLDESVVVEEPIAEEVKANRVQRESLRERLSNRALEKRPERITEIEAELIKEKPRERTYDRHATGEKKAAEVGKKPLTDRALEKAVDKPALDQVITPEKKRHEEKKKFVKEYTAPAKVEDLKVDVEEDSTMDKTLEQFAAAEDVKLEPKVCALPESMETAKPEESKLEIDDSMFDKTLEQFASAKALEPKPGLMAKTQNPTTTTNSRPSRSKYVPVDEEYDVNIKLKIPKWTQLFTSLNRESHGTFHCLIRTLLALLVTFIVWYILESLAHYFIGKPSYATSDESYDPSGPVWGEAIPFLLQEYLGEPIAWVARLPRNVVSVWPRQVRERLYEWAIRVSFSDMEREAMRLGVPIAALYRSDIANTSEEWSMSMDEVL